MKIIQLWTLNIIKCYYFSSLCHYILLEYKLCENLGNNITIYDFAETKASINVWDTYIKTYELCIILYSPRYPQPAEYLAIYVSNWI